MTGAVVRRLHPAESSAASEVIHEAFSADPILRWVWPDDSRWDTVGRAFVDCLVEVRVSGGEAWVSDDLTAVALWDPPGGIYASRPGLWETFNQLLTPDEAARLEAYDRHADDAQPAQPRWYLGVLAVTPAEQGRGTARRLVTPVLHAADRTGTQATLETATPINVAIYARFGFGPHAELDLPDGGPTVWLLRRPPG